MSFCCHWSFIPSTVQEMRSSRWIALQVYRRSLTITKSRRWNKLKCYVDRRGRRLLCLCAALEKYGRSLASGELIFQDGCVIFRSLLVSIKILRFIFFIMCFGAYATESCKNMPVVRPRVTAGESLNGFSRILISRSSTEVCLYIPLMVRKGRQ
jgi:hypothetical protein